MIENFISFDSLIPWKESCIFGIVCKKGTCLTAYEMENDMNKV